MHNLINHVTDWDSAKSKKVDKNNVFMMNKIMIEKTDMYLTFPYSVYVLNYRDFRFQWDP